MDRIKSFSGSVSSNTSETINKSYGISSGTLATERISRERTDVLNNALVEFLGECGVDVNYDGNYLWINGAPVTFYFYQNYNHYSCCFPFNTTAIAGSTSTTDIFNTNGLDYNFKVRLLGEPTTAFILVISRNYTTPSFSQAFGFFKAANIINGKNSRLYTYNSFNAIYAVDLDGEGLPINIGRGTSGGVTPYLNLLPADYSNNAGKYPLVEWNPAIFKAEGCCYGLTNSPLPNGNSVTSDAQTFIRLGEDIYYVSYNGPLIKCIS